KKRSTSTCVRPDDGRVQRCPQVADRKTESAVGGLARIAHRGQESFTCLGPRGAEARGAQDDGRAVLFEPADEPLGGLHGHDERLLGDLSVRARHRVHTCHRLVPRLGSLGKERGQRLPDPVEEAGRGPAREDDPAAGPGQAASGSAAKTTPKVEVTRSAHPLGSGTARKSAVTQVTSTRARPARRAASRSRPGVTSTPTTDCAPCAAAVIAVTPVPVARSTTSCPWTG